MKNIFLLAIVLCFSFFAKAQTFSWSGSEPVADFQRDSIPIVVSGLPSSIDTTFGLAHICNSITHTYLGDLVIRIVAPNGDSLTLIQGTGGGGDNFNGTCVGVDGTLFSNTTAPYNGLFQPFEHTSLLNNGMNPNGTWYLIVQDVAAGDIGTITNASIEFTNNPPQYNGSTTVIPTGTYVCPTCVCPGGAAACDLLPDMTSSYKEINLNHNETPGALYISNATPNIGYGPMEIYGIDSCYCGSTHVPCTTICPPVEDLSHLIRQRIYQKLPGSDRLGLITIVWQVMMSFHPAHGHLHVDNFANYTLRTATSNPDATTWPIVGTGTKQSFCF